MPFTTLNTMNCALIEQVTRPSVTCLWTIENFSYCLQNTKNDHLKTPPYSRLLMKLILCPLDEYRSKYISFFLQTPRLNGKCELELSLIAADGSCLQKYETKSCTTTGWLGKTEFIAREEVFKNRDVYLPQDTLTVCCRLYINPDDYEATGKYFARTRIIVDKRTFPWHIPLVNSFHEFEEKTVHMGNSSFGMKFYFHTGTVAATKVKLEIRPHLLRNCFLTCKIYIMDAKGTVRISLQGEHHYEKQSGNPIWNFPTFVKKNELLSGNYLKDDKLFLRCELAVSFGEVSIEFNEIHALNKESNAISKELTSLKDDILCIYKDQKFVDAKLCTAEKQFPVHRVILSARSPVFSRMFEAAFKEGKTGIVEITDVDADTTRRMLQFIYTDSMEDLGWEEASSLYSAADKYDIPALRKTCASILESKLTVSNFHEALLLAEFYQGQSYLGKVVQDFIVAHEEEVLRSEEWRSLEVNQPRVTLKVLRQVCLQKLANTK